MNSSVKLNWAGNVVIESRYQNAGNDRCIVERADVIVVFREFRRVLREFKICESCGSKFTGTQCHCDNDE